MAIFTGSGVALVTPFHEDESINYDKLDEMLDYHCTHGTDSIIICGTTGESSTLSEEEHMECIKFAIERVKGRIPVIAGTGSNCTREAIHLSNRCCKRSKSTNYPLQCGEPYRCEYCSGDSCSFT